MYSRNVFHGLLFLGSKEGFFFSALLPKTGLARHCQGERLVPGLFTGECAPVMLVKGGLFSEGPFAQGTCIPGQYRCAAQRGARVDAGASGMTGRPRHSERTLG